MTCGFTAETLGNDSLPLLDLQDPPFSNASLSNAVESYIATDGPACEEHEDLDYLAHINTPNLARDLELIRDLMGYDEVNLWAISFGSIIGTAYAAMFPQRVGRIILDGLTLHYVADLQLHSVLGIGWASPVTHWTQLIEVLIKFLGYFALASPSASRLPRRILNPVLSPSIL